MGEDGSDDDEGLSALAMPPPMPSPPPAAPMHYLHQPPAARQPRQQHLDEEEEEEEYDETAYAAVAEEEEEEEEELSAAEWGQRWQARMQRMKGLLDSYDAAAHEQRDAFYLNDVEAAHVGREPVVKPRNQQSYFASYWQDELGKVPPTVGQSEAIKLHLRELSDAVEENGWTSREEVRLS